MKSMSVQATSMAVLVAAAMLLGCGMVAPAQGSRALLGLGTVIDNLIDCPPPPAEEAPAPEPYSAPYYSPPDVESPAPAAYVPSSPEYQSPPGPPYGTPVASSPSPDYEPSPEYPTPPAGGY